MWNGWVGCGAEDDGGEVEWRMCGRELEVRVFIGRVLSGGDGFVGRFESAYDHSQRPAYFVLTPQTR